jgi:hypothetical protein
VPPVFDPELVAEIILECAQQPRRDVIVGGMGKVISLANAVPRLADRYMERSTFESQKTEIQLAATRRDNLYEPLPHDGGERGSNWSGRTARRSIYTAAVMHPAKALAVAASAGLAVLGARAALKNSSNERNEDGS